MATAERDRWAEWLAVRRFGGDADVRREFLEELARTRAKVLENAGLAAGETLLDVGCGDGLIAFGALDRGAAEVIFSDISLDLLDECRSLAREMDVLGRCRFVQAAAEDLSPIADASVDVVTTRSVLIYVKEKQRALAEFRRVLRPGGRISLFEPINRFACSDRVREKFWAYDLSAIPEIAEKLTALYEAIQPPDSDPMLDFDERDLVTLAERAGFFPVELELHAEVSPIEPRRWESFLHMSGNPNIPTLAEAMEETLTADERAQLIQHLRPLVEEGRGVWRMAKAYLRAVKPEREPRY